MPSRRPRNTLAVLAALLWPGMAACAATQPPLPVAISIDADAGRHPISPLIYGLSFATPAVLHDLRATINRSGGNSASAYNWRLDARNAGRDWFYESLPVNPQDINDQFNTRFVTLTQQAHALAMLTIPMIGRTATLGDQRKRLASFSVAKYGLQQDTDLHGMTDAGNGVALDGTPILDNDPNDATTPDSPANEHERVAQLVREFGNADSGGVRYYLMDNEPSLWQLIHRDIHPVGAHAREIADKVIAYSGAVKSADPGALVVAPEEWGWAGYHYSGFDQQYVADHGLGRAPDRQGDMHGMDYVPWLLTQWKQAGHPIDVFSLHFYPQGGEFDASGHTPDTPAIALARNRSTRDLWDPAYKDPSWINSVVALIPLMRKWVNTYYYPGTPIALTEYNWGGENTMNGATAQADLLGIFGREGLDIATRWGTPTPSSPVYKAMKLYRNYDDQGSGFGSISAADTVPDPDTVSSFAALSGPGDVMTVMVINKQLARDADTTLSLDHFASRGTVQTWQLADNAISRQPDTRYADGRLHAVLPPQSVTLFILRGAQSQ